MAITRLDIPETETPIKLLRKPPTRDTYKDINPAYTGSESGEYVYGSQATAARLSLLFHDTAFRVVSPRRDVRGRLSALLFDQLVSLETAQSQVVSAIRDLLKEEEPTIQILNTGQSLESDNGQFVLWLRFRDMLSGDTFEQPVTIG